MRTILLLASALAFTFVPGCTEKDESSATEYCLQPYACPEVPHIDCMPDGGTSPDICSDTVCRSWMVTHCGTVISM